MFLLTCKLSQGAKMSSNSMKNVVLDMRDGLIELDQRLKTRDGWVAKVDFIHENSCEKAHTANENH